MNHQKSDAVPIDWETKTIEELVEEGRAIGYGVLKPGPHTEGGVRLVKSNQVRDGYVDLLEDYRISPELDKEFKRTRLKGGELLLNVVGSIGRSAIAPPDLIGANVSRAIAVLPLDKERVQWVQLFLSSPKCQAEMFDRKVGIAQPVLNLGQVRKLVIPLPPLPQQRRVVAEIEKQFTRLDAGVAALRRVQANLKRYRAAVLKAACEGHLVPTEAELAKAENRKFETGGELLARILTERRQNWQGRGKYKESYVPDTTRLGPLPDGWCWLSVDTVAFVTKLAGFEYTKFVKYDPNGDIAVIKAENAGLHGFKRTNFSRVKHSAVAHLTRSQLKPGDLLMVFVGNVGNVARVPNDQSYFLGPNIAMMRAEVSKANPAFLELFLRSPNGRSLALGYVKAVAQPSLSMGTIRMIPVALPPLAEQMRIVTEVERRLSVVEELEAAVSANLQRAMRLRQSILRIAFMGGLT